MRIAKPLLLVATPVGVVLGVVEGYRLAGGLVVLMLALIGLITAAAGTVVCTVRREQRAEDSRRGTVAQTRATREPLVQELR